MVPGRLTRSRWLSPDFAALASGALPHAERASSMQRAPGGQGAPVLNFARAVRRLRSTGGAGSTFSAAGRGGTASGRRCSDSWGRALAGLAVTSRYLSSRHGAAAPPALALALANPPGLDGALQLTPAIAARAAGGGGGGAALSDRHVAVANPRALHRLGQSCSGGGQERGLGSLARGGRGWGKRNLRSAVWRSASRLISSRFLSRAVQA